MTPIWQNVHLQAKGLFENLSIFDSREIHDINPLVNGNLSNNKIAPLTLNHQHRLSQTFSPQGI